MIFTQVNLSFFARENYMMFSAFENHRFYILFRGRVVRGFYFVSFRRVKFCLAKIRHGDFNGCFRLADFVSDGIFTVNGIVFAVYFFQSFIKYGR